MGSEGLRALTMRRIGTELGADPTAIYRHFRNKEALLTCLAERLFATEPELDPADPWQEQLRIHIRHAFERYRAHPDLGILLARQPDDLRPLVRICEQTLDLLVAGAGLSLEQASDFSHLIENHVVGCGLFFAISDYRDPFITDRDAMRRAYAVLPAGRVSAGVGGGSIPVPRPRRHVRAHDRPPHRGDRARRVIADRGGLVMSRPSLPSLATLVAAAVAVLALAGCGRALPTAAELVGASIGRRLGQHAAADHRRPHP